LRFIAGAFHEYGMADMNAAAAPGEKGMTSKRRFARCPLTVPVEISVLRAGVPETIPGRAVDLGEGGLSAIVAGEFQTAQTVGLNFRFPERAHTFRAKALVRHQQMLHCGLEFLGLSEEQLDTIRAWTKNSREPSSSTQLRLENSTNVAAPKARLRWIVIPFAVLLLLAAAWWYWQRAWEQLESGHGKAASAETASVISVPPEVMKSLVIHQVAPVYPEAARAGKLQGAVLLDVEIGEDGSVTKIAPISGDPIFLQPAMDAVRWWRFQPYRLNGAAEAVKTTVSVEFQP
jgi:TonB family protein